MECVKGLPEVFDTNRRPWIDHTQAPAETVAEIVRRFPAGALQYILTYGPAEVPPTPTTIRSLENELLAVRGDLLLITAVGEQRETRVLFCTCGCSADRPFCDNSHKGPTTDDA